MLTLNIYVFTPQIVDEDFLELVNNLLTFGRIPALFSPVEMDRILEQSCLNEDQIAGRLQGDEAGGAGGAGEEASAGDCRSVLLISCALHQCTSTISFVFVVVVVFPFDGPSSSVAGAGG